MLLAMGRCVQTELRLDVCSLHRIYKWKGMDKVHIITAYNVSILALTSLRVNKTRRQQIGFHIWYM